MVDDTERALAYQRACRRAILHLNRSGVHARPSLAIHSPIADMSAVGRAVHWLLPWTQESYPGIRLGVGELLAGRASWEAFRMWRAGRRTPPQWFVTLLADQLAARRQVAAEIEQELRDWKPPVHRARGAMAVDPVTGQDRRGGRIGRRGKRTKSNQGKHSSAPEPENTTASQPLLGSDFD